MEKTMHIIEMIETVAALTGQEKKVVKLVISTFLNEIKEYTSQGGEVRLGRFGAFAKHHRKARKGRNPQTGKIMRIAPSDWMGFKSYVKF